jgi:hypothetical protein
LMDIGDFYFTTSNIKRFVAFYFPHCFYSIHISYFNFRIIIVSRFIFS